jgi:phage nucleotide-binding protein
MDIFNPIISKATEGIEGKSILMYGSNRTGKTSTATKFPKPFYLPFENGLNAISGIPFLQIQKWSDFKKINKQLALKKNLDKAKEKYQTLIYDGVESAALMCQDYVCQKHGAESIKNGSDGYGLWKEYETEFKRELNLLISAGYTVIFISHEGDRKFLDDEGKEYTKIYPSGDKRSIDPICDLVDIIAYAKVNGLDENGQEIKSSLLLTNTKQYHAGSRFDYLEPFLKEFTADNLENAIKKAVEEQEKHNKNSTVDFSDYRSELEVERQSFDEMISEIKQIAIKLDSQDRMSEYQDIVEEYLGRGAKVSEATKKQEESIELILSDLKELEVSTTSYPKG